MSESRLSRISKPRASQVNKHTLRTFVLRAPRLMFGVGADVGTSTSLGCGSPPPEECVDTGAKLVLWGISLLCVRDAPRW